MPTVNGVLETALYVEDLPRAVKFYKTVFNFEILVADQRLCAMSVADQQVLLLFQKGASTKPMQTAGGTIPPHGGAGNLHMAFAINATELEKWENWLEQNGVKIESKVKWPDGGQSLYVRDPDNHAIELATPGTWKIY